MPLPTDDSITLGTLPADIIRCIITMDDRETVDSMRNQYYVIN